MDNEIKKIRKILSIVVILCLFSIALFSFLFWQVILKNQNIHSLENEMEYYSERNIRLKNMEIFIKDLDLELDVLDSFFLDGGLVVAFIEEIESLGRGLGLEVKTSFINIESSSDDNIKEYLRIIIETESSEEQFFKFLSILENLPYHVIFDQVSLRNILGPEEVNLSRGLFEFKVLKKK